jgi:hypothetical protein
MLEILKTVSRHVSTGALKDPKGSSKGPNGAPKASRWGPLRTLMGLPEGPDEALMAPIGPLWFVIGPPKAQIGSLKGP